MQPLKNDSLDHLVGNSQHGLLGKLKTKEVHAIDAIEVTQLSIIDRLLPLWVLLACSIGIGLGQLSLILNLIEKTTTHSGTNVLVAIGLMLMMYPPLAKVKWTTLDVIFKDIKVLALSFIFNWIICPISMFLLSWLFFGGYERTGLMSGLSLVGCARCFAMVLVWNHIAKGDADCCAAIAALNSVLTIFLYSPYALLFVSSLPEVIGISGEHVSIHILQVGFCVLTYMGIPLFAAIIIAFAIIRVKGPEFYHEVYCPKVSPMTLFALLFTIIVIFSSNSGTVLKQLPLALYAAIPMLIYFCTMFALAFYSAFLLKIEYPKACAVAFTAASNNLEIAIAVAISSFGLHSDEAVMCVVAALIEIPTMLTLINIAPYIRERWTTSTDGYTLKEAMDLTMTTDKSLNNSSKEVSKA